MDGEAKKLSSYIQKDIENRILSLNRMASRWMIHKGTQRNEFYKDAQHYIIDMPGFQAVEWIDKNFIVRWVIPLAGNEQVQGLNLGFEKNRRIALEKAMNSREQTMTAPIDLVQGGKGILSYYPLYIDNKFDGFISAVFRMSDWLNYIFWNSEHKEHFDEIKILVSFDDVIVYKQDGWDENRKTGFESANLFVVMGHRFKVLCRPTTAFIESRKSELPVFSLAFGLLMSILISFSVFLFLKANNETWVAKIVKRDLEIEISERKKIEDALQKTSARLELATKAGKVGIWSLDLTTNVFTWNDIMYEIYGIPSGVKLNYDTWQNALYPDDREETEALLTNAVKENAVFDTEFRIILADGRVRNIHAAAKVERDNTGKPTHMIGVNWDISSLKQIETELKQQTEMQEILMNISSKYINIPLNEVDSAIQAALAEIGHFVSADRAYVFNYDFNEQTMSNLYEWCNNGGRQKIEGLQNIPLAGLEDWVSTHPRHQPMLVPNVSELPDGILKTNLISRSIKTLIAVPMINGNDLLGFVSFDWIAGFHGSSKNELNLLQLFSRILVNIQMRKLAEKTLLESKNRLDLALKGTMASLWDWYVQTGEVVFNERWAEIVGYTISELEPVSIQTWINLCHPEDLEGSDKLLQSHFEGKTTFYDCEVRMKHKNGEWIWVADRGQVVEWDNEHRPLRMIGTHIDITERKKNEETIRHLANHDALTGLPTLRLANDRALHAIHQSKRKKTMAGFMFIDLDGFKAVNDNYGHEAGDALLKDVANRFEACVRKTDTVARIGGDEFLVIINEIQSTDVVVQIAGKFLQAVSRPFTFNEQQMKVGASIGISIYPNDGDDIDYLIKQADTAMYRIKNTGKNSYAFASSEGVGYGGTTNR